MIKMKVEDWSKDISEAWDAGERDSLRRVLVTIEKDINYQKTKLVGDFEKDKPINWRITGFEYLKNFIDTILKQEKSPSTNSKANKK